MSEMSAVAAPLPVPLQPPPPPRYPSAPTSEAMMSEAPTTTSSEQDKSHHLPDPFALQPPQLVRELFVPPPTSCSMMVPAMSPAINRAAHRHELPAEDEEDDRVEGDMSPPPPPNHSFSQNNNTQYYTNGNNYYNYRSGPPSLTPSTPFSIMSSPGVVLQTPGSGPFGHHIPLYSPSVSPNAIPSIGLGKPDAPTNGMPWYQQNNFHHAGVAGGYSPGTSFPFPTVQQHLEMPKNGRKKDRLSQDDEEEILDIDDEDVHHSSLGLNAGPEERIHVTRREDIRRARIEAEQRRRSHLRSGFEKLQQVLPQTAQRNSKSAILDRATTHIQTLQAAFNKCSSEREMFARQVEELRRLNDTITAALAAAQTQNQNQNRPGTPPPPPRHY